MYPIAEIRRRVSQTHTLIKFIRPDRVSVAASDGGSSATRRYEIYLPFSTLSLCKPAIQSHKTSLWDGRAVRFVYLCSLLSDSSWIWERCLAPILPWNNKNKKQAQRIQCQLITDGDLEEERDCFTRQRYRGDKRHLPISMGADRRYQTHTHTHKDSRVEISYLYPLRNVTPGFVFFYEVLLHGWSWITVLHKQINI